MSRVKALKFVGEYDDFDGKPLRFFPGIPARDLDEFDIANLTDEQYATVTGENPLYVAPQGGKQSGKPDNDAKKEPTDKPSA